MTPLTDTKPCTVGAMDAAYLLSQPRTERNRILAIAAESAAPLYEADLALPVGERDMTAFTTLDGEPFYTK